jgi:hypothetical protein
MGDTLFGALQQLSSGTTAASDFAATVQADWEKSHS